MTDERRTPHRITPTALDWERVRERARLAGVSMSGYLRERAVAAPRDAGGTHRPPPEHDWRRLAADVRAARERLAGAPSGRPSGAAVADIGWLFANRTAALLRAGRARELEVRLRRVLGARRGLAVYDAIAERAGPVRRP